jgi:hypothetical protein
MCFTLSIKFRVLEWKLTDLLLKLCLETGPGTVSWISIYTSTIAKENGQVTSHWLKWILSAHMNTMEVPVGCWPKTRGLYQWGLYQCNMYQCNLYQWLFPPNGWLQKKWLKTINVLYCLTGRLKMYTDSLGPILWCRRANPRVKHWND